MDLLTSTQKVYNFLVSLYPNEINEKKVNKIDISSLFSCAIVLCPASLLNFSPYRDFATPWDL